MGKSQREPKKKRRGPDEKKEKPTSPWIYVAFLVLVSGGALPVLLPMFEKMSELGWLDFATPAFTQLDPNSTDALKQVFFSGDPWLVLCKNKTERAPKVWQAALTAIAADADPQGLQLGVMPCFDPLPSGKTVYERFPTIKAPPTNVYVPRPAPHAFYVANGKKPAMLPQSYFSYTTPDVQVGEKIVKLVKKNTKPSYGLVASNADLTKKCLKKGLCAIVVNRGKLDSDLQDQVKKLMFAHRLVNFVRLDTTKRKLSIQDKLPLISGLSKEEGAHETRLVLLKKRKKENGKGYLALALDQPFTPYYTDTFLTAAAATLSEGNEEGEEVLVLKKAPTIAMKNGKAKKSKTKTESSSKKEKKEQKEAEKKTPEKTKEERAAREQARREEMERETKDSFSYVEDADEDDEVVDLDDDEDETIDLDDDEEGEAEEEEEAEEPSSKEEI